MSNFELIFAVCFLVTSSALASGLNVAVMSLDLAQLERRAKLGNRAAIRALPFRQNRHLTLASILLTNVAVISANSLVLADRISGLAAGTISTMLIVIFGELVPQAIFVKNALKLTSFLAPVLKFLVTVTYPVSKPLQLLLDMMLGSEQRQLESRHELGILIADHASKRGSELDEDEVEIIRGALSLSEKRVRDIMTPIDKVYYLTPDTDLSDEKIDEIKAAGHSRWPIFNNAQTKCYGILLVKDLVDVDFDRNKYQVDDMPIYPSQIVGNMTALDTLLRKFITTSMHLLAVEKDDRIAGIVTIEDLIEEIIGHEIEDESDQKRRHRLVPLPKNPLKRR